MPHSELHVFYLFLLFALIKHKKYIDQTIYFVDEKQSDKDVITL